MACDHCCNSSQHHCSRDPGEHYHSLTKITSLIFKFVAASPCSASPYLTSTSKSWPARILGSCSGDFQSFPPVVHKQKQLVTIKGIGHLFRSCPIIPSSCSHKKSWSQEKGCSPKKSWSQLRILGTNHSIQLFAHKKSLTIKGLGLLFRSFPIIPFSCSQKKSQSRVLGLG